MESLKEFDKQTTDSFEYYLSEFSEVNLSKEEKESVIELFIKYLGIEKVINITLTNSKIQLDDRYFILNYITSKEMTSFSEICKRINEILYNRKDTGLDNSCLDNSCLDNSRLDNSRGLSDIWLDDIYKLKIELMIGKIFIS
jgi:hypothetical protein